MAYWWVNHSQTRDHEVQGDYLWSPKFNRNGARNRSYDNMAKAVPGDVVFSYADGRIGAVGIVYADASTAPKPLEFGNTGAYWSNEGWFLPVAFEAAPRVIRPRDFIARVAPLLPETHAPIRGDGNGNQGTYLAEISDELGKLLVELTQFVSHVADIDRDGTSPVVAQMADIDQLRNEPLAETQRDQLVKARIGQGIFRSLVLLKHPACRVTGVTDKRLLRASHIKPWKDSTNFERLDGNNGIMLSPHLDALFDQGLMSFEDNGRALFRNDLDRDVIQKWSVPPSGNATPFAPNQRPYLSLHRERLAAHGAYRY